MHTSNLSKDACLASETARGIYKQSLLLCLCDMPRTRTYHIYYSAKSPRTYYTYVLISGQ